MRHEGSRMLGVAQVILSGLCFGCLGLFGKRAFALGITPGAYLSLRFLTASLFLGLYLLARKPAALRASAPLLARCVALGVLGYAVFSSCYFQALQGLSASLTVLLLYTYPVFVALGARVFFGERLARAQWIALPLVLAGLALLVGGDLQASSALSFALGFASALFYTLYILASSQLLGGVDPLTSTFYIMLSAGVALACFSLRSLPVGAEPWLVIAGTALVGTLLAMAFFLVGLQKIRSGEASLLSAMEPVTGIALAWVFLGERFTSAQGAGALLVLAALVMVALATRQRV